MVALQARAVLVVAPADEGGGLGQRRIARVTLDPVAIGVLFLGAHQVQGGAGLPAVLEVAAHRALEAEVAALLVFHVDGQGRGVGGDDLVRPDVVQRGLRLPEGVGIAPAQLDLATLDPRQRVVVDVQAGLAVELGRVGQIEALAVVAPQLVAVVEVVDGADVVQVDLVVVAAALRGLEVIYLDVRLLVPRASGDGEVVGRLPVQLAVERQGVDHVARVARRAAGGFQLEAAAFRGNQLVEGLLLGVEALMVEVHAVGELQAVPLLAEQPLDPADLEVLLRGGEVHAVHPRRLAGVVVGKGIEVVVFLAVVGLQVEVLVEQVAVVVVGVDQGAPGARLQIHVQTAAQLGVFEVGRRLVVQVGKMDAGAAVVAGVVVLRQQVEALLLVELHGHVAEHVDGAVVLQVGLGVVDEDLIAAAVVERLVLLQRDTEPAADPLVAAGDRLRCARSEVVAVVEAGSSAGLGLEARRARRALLRDDVDDAAGGAAAVDGAGAGQHLDALDVERRDAVELARQAARAVLADPVDHHQHVAATQVLAVVGAPFRRQVEAGDQLAEGFLEADAGIQLLLQLFLLHHPDGAGNRADVGGRACGHGDLHRRQVQRAGIFLPALEHHGALVAERPAHAAAGEQRVQRFLQGIAAVQPGALQALDVLGAEHQVHAGLVGELGQGAVEAARGDVQFDAVAGGSLDQRGAAEHGDEEKGAGEAGVHAVVSISRRVMRILRVHAYDETAARTLQWVDEKILGIFVGRFLDPRVRGHDGSVHGGLQGVSET
ncbi:hypothetical protein D9M68_360830 [compost metagenome]